MAVQSVSGTLSGITENSAILTYDLQSSGNSAMTFTLTATPVGGGAPIVLQQQSFTLRNGEDLTDATRTFEYDLPAGSYTFSVVGTQTGGQIREFNVATSPVTEVDCFLPGTLIATPKGEVAIETLAAGDLVLTADGRSVPVLWLGKQSVSTLFGMTEAGMPIRIAAGALGEGLPLRDLCVSARHALLLDGVLVNAGALVNGVTITRMSRGELGTTFPVFHVETANHEVILAEGVATETFMDNISRTRFDNYAEFEAACGAEGNAKAELDQPRAMSPRQVPASIRERIAAQLPASARAAA